MKKLIQEASLDDRFNVQMKKVQDAIEKLRVIVDVSRDDALVNLTSTQKMQLRHAAEDFKQLYDKA